MRRWFIFGVLISLIPLCVTYFTLRLDRRAATLGSLLASGELLLISTDRGGLRGGADRRMDVEGSRSWSREAPACSSSYSHVVLRGSEIEVFARSAMSRARRRRTPADEISITITDAKGGRERLVTRSRKRADELLREVKQALRD